MSTNQRTHLFSPVQLGAIQVANGVAIAVVTPPRAGDDGVPRGAHLMYYRQRASAGLIITEGVNVTPLQRCEPVAAGIWDHAQVEGWKNVTGAVHALAGKIALLLCHAGAPTDLVARYVHAAENAKRAGFDGIEIDASGSFLLDQALRDSIPHRAETRGDGLGARVRMVLEVVDGVAKVWGSERVGVRLSPTSPERDDVATCGRLIDRLNTFDLAYLHFVQGTAGMDTGVQSGADLDAWRARVAGACMTSFPSGWSLLQ